MFYMKSFNPKFAWFDGKFVKDDEAKVSVMTHAIHYGTSVFEGLRGYWNSKNLYIFRLDDHIKRFRNSGRIYSISLKFTDKEIFSAIINLCKKINNIKILLNYYIIYKKIKKKKNFKYKNKKLKKNK